MQIVDTEPRAGRHQVLDCGNANTIPDKSGSQHRFANGFSADSNRYLRLQIGTMKHDTGIGSRGPKHQFDFVSGMQSDPDRAGWILYGTLLQHDSGRYIVIQTPDRTKCPLRAYFTLS